MTACRKERALAVAALLALTNVGSAVAGQVATRHPRRSQGGYWDLVAEPGRPPTWTWRPQPEETPAAPGPQVAARARPRFWPWIVGAPLALIVAVQLGTGGGDRAALAAVDGGSSAAAAPSVPATARPAGDEPSTSLPLQDGDWRLDRMALEADGRRSFGGRAFVTYTGADTRGGSGSFAITVFDGGRQIATMRGSTTDVAIGQTKSVALVSTAPYVVGDLTYTFHDDLVR